VWLKISRVASYKCRFYFDVDRHQRKFLATLGAFSFVLVDDFVWRSELRALIQNVVTSVTGYTLRHLFPLSRKIRARAYLSLATFSKRVA
jgi:hypothetical protein